VPKPLDGIRILDFSHALAGPYCTMILSQYGADVFKIESPDAGDVGRSWAPPYTGHQASYFLGINAGKRSLAIDLKTPEGLGLCFDMIAKADVLIENMRPGTFDRLGLGYAKASARNPRLIYCSVSGYGQNGPSRDDPAMDLIVQASSGLISVTGVEGGDVVRCGHSVADITSGMFALIGILLAIEARNRTGAGDVFKLRVLHRVGDSSGPDGDALCDHRAVSRVSVRGSRDHHRGRESEIVGRVLHRHGASGVDARSGLPGQRDAG
jgi:formyl-CoA transferase/CoA:oxalate CoA-transferase